MSFLFKSKLFLAIAIVTVVIMLFSIAYALFPKNEDTSASLGTEETLQEQERNGSTTEPGDDGLIADDNNGEEAPTDDQYYTDTEAEDAGYTLSESATGTDAEAVTSEGDDEGSSDRGRGTNPWLSICPTGTVEVTGGCACPPGQVGTPGNCTAPGPIGTTPPPAGVTLRSSQAINPAKTYVLTANTKVRNVPGGTNAGPTIYKTSTKFDIVEVREYSDGSKFLLTKDQKDHGSKVGFPSSVMKVYTPPAPTPAPVIKNPVKKVLVFVMENKRYSEAKANMPYTMNLVKSTGVVYTNSWSAGEWKSLPNYIALAGGSNFGIVSDNGKPINGPSIFGLAMSNGKTAKLYSQEMKKNCTKHKHNPWAWYTPDQATCKKFDVPFSPSFASDVKSGNLPKVGFVNPNAINNGHDSDPKHADAFFKSQMQMIMQGPDWKSGTLAVVLTYDEAKLRDQKARPGQILTTLYHPALKNSSAHAINTRIQHYSITRLWAEVAGVWTNNPRVSVRQLKSPGNTNVVNATSMTSQLGITPDPN